MTTHAGAEQETQTWWRADKLGAPRITPFEVVRVTAATVSFLDAGRPWRAYIDTTWDRWFPSETEAVAFQRERLAEKVRMARESLDYLRAALSAFDAAHPLPVDTEV